MDFDVKEQVRKDIECDNSFSTVLMSLLIWWNWHNCGFLSG